MCLQHILQTSISSSEHQVINQVKLKNPLDFRELKINIVGATAYYSHLKCLGVAVQALKTLFSSTEVMKINIHAS